MLQEARDWFQGHDKEAVEFLGPYASNEMNPSEQAAWMTLLRLILNLDEFFTRE